MAGRRKSVGPVVPVNYHELPRKKLQALCKKHGFPANKTNVAMAYALTAFLNAPERLASYMDSPAMTSESSYMPSSQADDSPMISPGVDSLPAISESLPEVFEGLRRTNLPEIMEEVEISPLEVAGNETSEIMDMELTNFTDSMTKGGAQSECEEKDIERMIDDSRTLDCELLDESRCEVPLPDNEVKKIELGERDEDPKLDNGVEVMDCNEISKTILHESMANVEWSDATDRSIEGLGVGWKESSNMGCDEGCAQVDGNLGRGMVDTSDAYLGKVTDDLVSTSQVMTKITPPASCAGLKFGTSAGGAVFSPHVHQVAEDGERIEDVEHSEDLTEAVEWITAANATTIGLADVLDIPGLKEDMASVPGSDSMEEAFTLLTVKKESGIGYEDTQLPLSVMPHSDPSEFSLPNSEGVSLVVDLNNRGFPEYKTLKSDGAIKINLQTGEGMSRGTGPQGANYSRDEFFGPYKGSNLPSLSPKVRRSLGLSNAVSIPRVTFSSPPKSRATLKSTNDFSFDIPLVITHLSPVALAPPRMLETGDLTRVEDVNTSDIEGKREVAPEASPIMTDSAEVSPVMKVNDEVTDRSRSCSPVAGYVKEIVNLLERNSGEKEAHVVSRKDVYKQSPLVRSSRIAADIERASKLGQAKRAVVLASKRSLWLPTTTHSSIEEEGFHIIETGTGSLTSHAVADIAVDGPFDIQTRAIPARPESHAHEAKDVGANLSGNLTSPQYDQGIEESGDPVSRNGEFNADSLSMSSPPTGREVAVSAVSDDAEVDQAATSADDSLRNKLLPLQTGPGLDEIKYVEIPRPVETNVECESISDLSWIRKATNLPTTKAQKLTEKVRRPASANGRKLELMERAAMNAALKKRTPKKSNSTRGGSRDSSGLSQSQEPYNLDSVDVEMEEVSPSPLSWTPKKVLDKSTGALSLRDSNKDLGCLLLDGSCSNSPKSPSIFLDEILRESTVSPGKELYICGKENDRLRRHQEEYKTPLTGRSKEKAIRAAEMNAASLREKILKQRRGIEEEDPTGPPVDVLKNSLLGRLL